MVRLGQGVDRTGRLADEALARAFAAVEEYAALVARPRRASRADPLLRHLGDPRRRQRARSSPQGVHERLGVGPEVLVGRRGGGARLRRRGP